MNAARGRLTVEVGKTTLHLTGDGSISLNEFMQVREDLLRTLKDALSSNRLQEALRNGRADAVFIGLSVIRKVEADSFRSSSAELNKIGDEERASVRLALAREDVLEWSEQQRLSIVGDLLRDGFDQLRSDGSRLRRPAEVPGDRLWSWLDAQTGINDPEERMSALRQSASRLDEDKLLVLGDDLVAAILQIATPVLQSVSEGQLGPLDDDRFAELRGYIVSLGSTAYFNFKVNNVLPELPSEPEWSAIGEDLRFVVASITGRDYWESF